MQTLTDKAWQEVTSLRDKSLNTRDRKERAECRRQLLPYIDAIKKCEIPKQDGLTLDGWCRDYLGAPISTFRAAAMRQLLHDPIAMFFGLFGPDYFRREDEEQSLKEQTSTFC